MTTEALDLSHAATATIRFRLPHGLLVLVRAIRIARIRRAHDRTLVDLELRRMNACSRHEQAGWLDDLAHTGMNVSLLGH